MDTENLRVGWVVAAARELPFAQGWVIPEGTEGFVANLDADGTAYVVWCVRVRDLSWHAYSDGVPASDLLPVRGGWKRADECPTCLEVRPMVSDQAALVPVRTAEGAKRVPPPPGAHVDLRIAATVEGEGPSGEAVTGAAVKPLPAGLGELMGELNRSMGFGPVEPGQPYGGAGPSTPEADALALGSAAAEGWVAWPFADGYWWGTMRVGGSWSRPVLCACFRGRVSELGAAGALSRGEVEGEGAPLAVYRWAGLVEPAAPGLGAR